MKLEQQVTSLGLSKRLKERGVPQEAIWQWVKLSMGDEPERWDLVFVGNLAKPTGDEMCATFTVAELGEILLRTKAVRDELGYRLFVDYRGKIVCGWDSCIDFSADTEAEARGLMLEYLIKNNLLSV